MARAAYAAQEAHREPLSDEWPYKRATHNERQATNDEPKSQGAEARDQPPPTARVRGHAQELCIAHAVSANTVREQH